jgi:sulfoxide reductase heme-binding subunit YedZ
LLVTFVDRGPSDAETFSRTASLALGYGSLTLTLLTLAVGPLRILGGRPNPRSTYLVRDLGIWAAIAAVAHVVAALQNHMQGVLKLFFFNSEEFFSWQTLRRDPFGIANHLGLIATAIIVLLLATSNNRSMRKLGGRRWKAVQRSNYCLAILIAAHTALYWLILERTRLLRIVFGSALVTVLGLQLAGFFYLRSRVRSDRNDGPRD